MSDVVLKKDDEVLPRMKPFENRQMCYWQIALTKGDDVIEARNDISGEKFAGTIEEFNARLRAK
jgi:hypothetical protein